MSTTKPPLVTCPACGEGKLHPHRGSQVAEHAGQTGEVALRYGVCDACGSEIATAADALANKRAMVAFEKQVDSLLSGALIRAFRKQYQLTQDLAATLFGGGKIGFSRYENDDVVQSTAMDNLLRLCMQDPANLLRLAKLHQAPLPAATRQAITAHTQGALLKLAPRIQQTLDACIAAQQGGAKAAAPSAHLPYFAAQAPANHERFVRSPAA